MHKGIISLGVVALGGCWLAGHLALAWQEARPAVLAQDVPPRQLGQTATPAAAQGQEVREVIERELKELTAEERQIWFEELKGLPAGIVEDLLRLRRQLNPPREPAGVPPARLVLPPAGNSTESDAWSSASHAWRKARALHLHNWANARSIGYRRMIPLMTPLAAPLDAEESHAGPWGCRWQGVMLDVRPGPLLATGRALDVAIQGPGWFVVRTAEGRAYTRCGRLILDDQGRLCVAGPDGGLPLEPSLTCPKDQPVTISADGTVWSGLGAEAQRTRCGQLRLAEISDPSLLSYRADGWLVLPADVPDAPWMSASSSGAGPFLPMTLEQSNVDADAEWAEVQRIDRWLQAVTAASIAAHGPGESNPAP